MKKKEQSQTLKKTSWSALNSISPWKILILLGLLVMIGILTGGAFNFVLSNIFKMPLKETMESLFENNDLYKRQYIRVALMVNHLFLFLLPSLTLGLVLFRKSWYRFLGLVNTPIKQMIANSLAGIILVLASMPFIQYIYFLNKNYLPLPEWARSIENNTNEMIKGLLVVDFQWELWINVFIIAVIPAFGEEFLFRGILQKQLGRFFQNHHQAIWIAASLFSLTHMQLEGFFPRLILGALLGYLFYWCKSLWIPVIVHLVYNGIQILALQLVPNQLLSLEKSTTAPVSIIGALISLAMIIGLSIFVKNYNQSIELAN